VITTTLLQLPRADGALEPYTPGGPSPYPTSASPPHSRVAYAAAHVVCEPLADIDPWLETVVDWEATLAYRHYLWGLGFCVAEAMDTAQRGMGLDWTTTQELIRRALGDAAQAGALDRIACGAGTDQLEPGPGVTLDDVAEAYAEQCGFIERHGGRIILMASRALAACARGADDYARVYDRILAQVRQPVIIHWLGDMFDPALAGYWGSRSVDDAMQTCLAILRVNAAKIDGIKISLLDAEREIAMRRLLPAGVKMYTGDDFNYPRLIRGDEHGCSHALLGILDAIAPVAAAALHALDDGDTAAYESILEPTVALSRHIFEPPTWHYKTGIVFLAWLNGHQSHFQMVAQQETARSVQHLSRLFVLADQAGLLRDPEMAVARMRDYLAAA